MALTPFLEVIESLNHSYEIRLNTSDMTIQIRDKPQTPTGSDGLPSEPGEWRALDSSLELVEILQTEGVIKASKELVKDFLSMRKYVPEFCPIKEYFDNLPTPRIGKGISAIIKKNSAISRVCAAVSVDVEGKENERERFFDNFYKWLIRCVKTHYEDYYYNKTMMLFVGGQNGGKSGFCSWLVPPALKRYYGRTVKFNKDGYIELAKLFLINIDEMAGLDRSEVETLKNYVAADSVYERPPYGEKPIYMKRKASFIANTNNPEFLRDRTGNVRFAVFRINSNVFSKKQNKNLAFDFDEIDSIDIDEMWAEAKELYFSGETGELNHLELAANELAAEEFRLISQEEELVKMYFRLPTENDTSYDKKYMNATEIKAELERRMRHESGSSVTLNKYALGSVMHAAGFKIKSVGRERTKKYELVETGYRPTKYATETAENAPETPKNDAEKRAEFEATHTNINGLWVKNS